MTFELAIAAVVAYRLAIILYRLWFHPLRAYPGPLHCRVSNLPLLYWQKIAGTWPRTLKEMHDRYGEIVRISPNELSCIYPEAWTEIYGHKRGGNSEFAKDPSDHATLDATAREHNLISSNNENHRRQRRLLAHAFSEQALRAQEPLMRGYVDLLIEKLKTQVHKPLDLSLWFNFCTFDIMGELGFGEPFNCLASSDYHEWIAIIFKSLRIGSYMNAVRFYRAGSFLLDKFIPQSLLEKRNKHHALAVAKADKRIAAGVTDRGDFMSYILKHNDEKGMSVDEIRATSGLLIIAGSETTATALSGVCYHLAQNPACYAQAAREVRTTYKTEEDISLLTVKATPYLQACIEEGMRLFPAVPSAFHRVVPKGGAVIRGSLLPEGTLVGCPQWAMYHSAKNFHAPEEFLPERWLGDSDARFANEKKDVFQPFSFGPRNCIGKNLAYAEMRLILTKVLWNFDFQVDQASRDWPETIPVYALWDKPPLWMQLKLVERTV